MRKIITNSKSNQINTDSGSKINIDITTDQSDATIYLEGQKVNYNALENLPKINDKNVEGSHNGSYYGLVDAIDGKELSSNDFTDELKEKVESIDNLDQSISEEVTARENAIEEVNQSISEEVTARENAIEEVNQSIESLGNTLSEEISSQVGIEEARATEKENELSNSISDEVSARENAIEEVNQSISEEVTARENAIEEVNQSISALNTTLRSVITSEVNNEKTRATTKENELSGLISGEVSARKSADTNLQNQINSINSDLQNTITDYNTKINSEKNRALTEENKLSGRITTNASNITKEVNDRKAAINNLSNVYVQKQTTINGKPLNSNINLTASDVGALSSSTVIGNGTITFNADTYDKTNPPISGKTFGTFNLNDTSNKTISIPMLTKSSQLDNDIQFTTETAVKRIVGGVINDTITEKFGDLDGKITNEATIRESADNNLQAQIDAITVSSDVRDIVETYADLTSYDKSKLINGDIIKVLRDETEDDKTTYYKYVKATDNFDLIGSEGPYYTVSDANNTFVPKTFMINNKELDGDYIDLDYADVDALPASTVVTDIVSSQEQADAINSGITDTLVTQIGTNESDIADINTIIGTYGDVVTHDTSEFATASQGAKADTALQPNSPITPGTHTKITYDSNGLVTGGSDLQVSDIPTIPVTKIDGLTVTSTELNVLDGVDVLTSEINYLKGVTSDIQTQLDNKVIKNSNITGSTKTKITYDSKGLVTGGADLEASDIPSLTLGKISDVNVSPAEVNALDGIDTSTTVQSQINSKQDALVSGTNIKTINGASVLGSGDLAIDSLPSQTDQGGKFLTTDGTTASWAEITTSESVEDLTDVDLTSVSNGQVLIYDSSDSKWKNGTLTGVSFTKITETLYSASWSNKSYSLTVPGVTNNSMIWVQPSYSASGNNELEYAVSNIRGVSQSADTIVFACVETPTRDVNIDIIIS